MCIYIYTVETCWPVSLKYNAEFDIARHVFLVGRMRRDMKSLDLHDSGSAALPHACRDPTQNSPARLHLFQEGGRGEMGPPPPVPAWPDCRPPCPMQLLPPLLPFSFQALIYGCLCLWLSNRGGEGGNSAGCEEDWGSSVPLSLPRSLTHTHKSEQLYGFAEVTTAWGS